MLLTDDGKATFYRKIIADETVVEQPNSLAAGSTNSGPVLEILDDTDEICGLDDLALAVCQSSSARKPVGDTHAVQVLRPSALRAQPKAKSASSAKGPSTKKRSATHVTWLATVSGLV